jgi:hypothetical protein
VLTDGLARAGEEGATHVVDIATLTGAVVRALGPSVAGVLGTDRDLIARVIRSGENHGEAFWELPLVEEYRDALKTPYADINNIAGGGLAGAITAGLFLREFVPEKGGLGPPRHRGADVPRQGLEVLRSGRARVRRETLVAWQRFATRLTDDARAARLGLARRPSVRRAALTVAALTAPVGGRRLSSAPRGPRDRRARDVLVVRGVRRSAYSD